MPLLYSRNIPGVRGQSPRRIGAEGVEPPKPNALPKAQFN